MCITLGRFCLEVFGWNHVFLRVPGVGALFKGAGEFVFDPWRKVREELR